MKIKIYKQIKLPTKCATEGESVEGTSFERVKLEYVDMEVDPIDMFHTLQKARRFIIQHEHDPEARDVLTDIDEILDETNS